MDWSTVWQEVLARVGTAAVLVAALGWIARLAIKRYFDAGIEVLKAELKLTNDRELAEARNRFTRELEAERQRAERRRAEHAQQIEEAAASRDRVRAEVVAWANPVLDAVRGLESRLRNILDEDGYVALDSAAPQPDPDWSVAYDYFLPSTLYLFGQYFCWVYLLEQEMSFELLHARQAERPLFDAIRGVSGALGDYPADPPISGTGHDAQVFRLQQRAMGEVLVARRGEGAHARRGCVGYATFTRKLADAAFAAHFAPLRGLVDGVKPAELRFARLRNVLAAVSALRVESERVLRLVDQTVA